MKRYSLQTYNKENMSRAKGVSLPISTKQSIEICNHIRNKKTTFAKRVLQEAIEGKKPIPYRRFNMDTGHKKGMGPGRFPKKAAQEILTIIKSAEANAQFAGLNTSGLIIKHVVVNKGPGQWRVGRKRRRSMKRTHVEIVLEETVKKKKQEKPKKPVEKPAKKETKPIEQKKPGPTKDQSKEKPKPKEMKKTTQKQVKKKPEKVPTAHELAEKKMKEPKK